VAQQKLIETDNDGQSHYLTFTVADELYTIAIMYIKEIIEYVSLTPVPMAPPYIRGVLNLRGNVLPVVDLAVRFGVSPQEVSKHTCIVIVEMSLGDESLHMGVVVDAVNDVLTLKADDFEPAPSFGSHIRAEFIRNIAKVDSRFIILLDVERVLSIEELAVK
jgi:purine-binding chemotaxis protein CheW